MLDVAICGGHVVDGLGSAPQRADIGVRDGRIVAIGHVDEPAHRRISAEGRFVTPGFVDVHTHLDVQGFWDPTFSPSPLHGVTTVIAGNCGFSVAPLKPDDAEFLIRMLARVEGMPVESLERGAPWDWRTSAEYFDRFENRLAVNAGFMVGHSAIRRYVMGPDASERAATGPEVASMTRVLRHGIAAGGLGFSSSWGRTHNDANGHPVPSRFAATDELVELSRVCAEFPGTSLQFLPQADEEPFAADAVDAMSAMCHAAQRPLNWNLILPRRDNAEVQLARLDAAASACAHHATIVGLVMPIRAPSRLSFHSGVVLDMLPGWGPPMALPVDAKLRLFQNPDSRERLKRLSQDTSPAFQDLPNWGDRVILETFSPTTQQYRGRLVADIAAAEQKNPFDALVDIACADGLQTTFTFNRDVMDPADWPLKVQIMRDARAVVGGSDAGAHLDMNAQFNYPTRLLGEAVRERSLLPLEELVEMLTSVPAALYSLRGRGRIAEGYFADLVVLDATAVHSGPIATAHDLPGGAGRLTAPAVGIDHVLVNGVEIVSHQGFTEARPGTVLRSGRHTGATPAQQRTTAADTPKGSPRSTTHGT